MPTFTAKKTIAVPEAEAWSQLDNFENIYVFHPGVEKSVSLNGQGSGKGAKRQCDFYDGGYAQEEVTYHDAKKKFFSVSIYDGAPMKVMKKFDVDFSVRAVGPSKSEVTIVGRFTPKFGPIGWLMGNLLIKHAISKKILEVVEGLERHVNTGELVGQG